ncbi:Uncharacterised protein [Serratia quinivorans]|jgi:thymidylate kinase|nr:Uncharacterised protein [Serratia quinivorans]CAI2083500.1 Uncharacterised protein [Serratia quinivorans]CAI2086972.1 Uncharacterised protein [Serratia quinivorans]CAI2102050.1 Uncharacterised protein [Serratia quinivorans]
MSRQLFVSLDGPKGAGKTTLLEAITKVLRADNKKVVRLCRRNDAGNFRDLQSAWMMHHVLSMGSFVPQAELAYIMLC